MFKIENTQNEEFDRGCGVKDEIMPIIKAEFKKEQ